MKNVQHISDNTKYTGHVISSRIIDVEKKATTSSKFEFQSLPNKFHSRNKDIGTESYIYVLNTLLSHYTCILACFICFNLSYV